MTAIEIQPIKKAITIRVSGNTISLPDHLRQKIDQHWQQLVSKNPRLHNGEAFTVTAVRGADDRLDIELAETDYAHYLYSHQVGGLQEFTVRIIHSSTLVITSDNKMIFGAMGTHTSRPGVIQCCGGGIDHDDIRNGVVDIQHNTAKELREELGLDPYDRDTVDDFYPAYLKAGGPTEKITLVYILRLKLSSSQFLRHYNAFVQKLKDNQQEPEFGQIFCIDIDQDTIETFIDASAETLNEYMPVLLRTIGATSSDAT